MTRKGPGQSKLITFQDKIEKMEGKPNIELGVTLEKSIWPKAKGLDTEGDTNKIQKVWVRLQILATHK